MATSASPLPPGATAPVLRVALNEHLRSVLARSSVRLDPARLGDAAAVMITEPTQVVYDDPRDPRYSFAIGTGRFVALDQAAGWVYGVNATPQDRAAPLDQAVAVARQLERIIAGTAWRKDHEAPWAASDDTVAAWARGADAELPIARFTAGPAAVQLTLKRTGAPAPSERLGGSTAELFYLNVGIADMSRLDAYQARLLRERRARGGAQTPLPLSAFMTAAASAP